ncbi:uncharacterized protein LOC133785360 [Humulus lupulus]|uniref:uncharacterized protein LOC133785360 n=1 Tax=Humulus lupulus TaxID=3486 RepID=UPI002B405540|nr:uncharacterized protein LOC133785360 [Humulus lupulus]
MNSLYKNRPFRLTRAKVLLALDKNYKKFNHVWQVLKDIEKFGDDHNNATSYIQRQSSNFVTSQSESPTTKSPTLASSGLSSFSLNINDENIGGCSTQRLIGVKKEKGIRENEEQTSIKVDTIKEEQRY